MISDPKFFHSSDEVVTILQSSQVISSQGFPATNFQIDLEASRRALPDAASCGWMVESPMTLDYKEIYVIMYVYIYMYRS
jgi:hypothetical protein